MRKIILFSVLLLASSGLLAQSIDVIKDMAGKNEWAKAREAVEKHLGNEKNAKKGDGWYWKAVIYNGISRDSVLSPSYPDARKEAFEAYKKYIELDPKMTWGILSQHATLFDICFGYLENASNDFNNKNFDQSLENFIKAEKVEEYIVAKGFTLGNFAFPAFDTQLYLNIAAAATQAKKEDVALEYYMKIAENKIVEENYVEIYRYVVDRLTRKGDHVKKEKFLAIGRELYPDDPFWCEVDLIEADEDPVKMFPIYEKLMQGPCGTYELTYNYAVDLFNYIYAQETKPADFAEKQATLTEVLKKAIAKRSTLDANLLMSKHIFSAINILYDELNAIKGTKPEDVKKKADLNALLTKKYDEALPYVNTAYKMYDEMTTLKAVEKGNFKLVVNMLLEYWDRKNDKAKVKELQDKMKSIE